MRDSLEEDIMIDSLSKYNKTIAALVIGILGWGGVVVNSEAASVTASEWLALGVAMATAIGVWYTPAKGYSYPQDQP